MNLPWPALRRGAIGALALVAAALLACGPASARVYFGVGVGVPLYGPPAYAVPPPYYYPPPPVWVAPPAYVAPPVVYAPPPPVMYVPPGFNAPAAARPQSCDAGAYRCPMDRPTTPGAACYCPANNGQRVWGHVQ